jgi:transposase InsO family protein
MSKKLGGGGLAPQAPPKIRLCLSCNGYFRGKLPRSAPLQPLLTGAPFERLHVDLTGPHPRSRRGSVYIVTCIDPFTKWAEAFPAPNKEAATVARIIVEQIFCRYGVPIALLTDRGKEVDGQLMAEVCRLLDIDKQRTTAYKASTNAAIERFHRTLNSMIGRMIDENQRDWDSLLP